MPDAAAIAASIPSTGDTYQDLIRVTEAIFEGEHDFIANAANLSALMFDRLDRLNWAGFYLFKEGELVLGPFQGKVACVRIALGKGVCGTAAGQRKTVVVPDVNAFPGHIACDPASRSEIVVPLLAGDRLVGVMDLDSPVPERFGEDDRVGLERLAQLLMEASNFSA